MFNKANLLKIGVGAGKMVGQTAVFILLYEMIGIGFDYVVNKIPKKKGCSTLKE